MAKHDVSILEAALIGYQSELAKIDAAMEAIRAQLGGRTVQADSPGPGRRPMSAAARRRIAAAQKKRWAQFHSRPKGPAKKAAAPKRKLSPAAKAKLIANLAKARAAKAAKAARAG
ncbi:MAG TPA: hypothetical protein VMH28_23370 [Candidatus Acidoferrales bacterium]|nr:hypothetical protein [Candidatus Acidoferrales bacterium]